MDLISNNDVERVKFYLNNSLSSRRLAHSQRTAEESSRLAGIYGLDCGVAYVAALFHDIARELPESKIMLFAKKYRALDFVNSDIESWELANPLLLHGAAGAWMLFSLFSIENKKLLEAVDLHTVGRREMDELAKLVYCADYLEPGRDFDHSEIDALIGVVSLDQLVAEIALACCRYNDSMGRVNFPPMIELSNCPLKSGGE